MPFRMPPMPFPMPSLFNTAAKDICAINTFEKIAKNLISEGYWLTFRLYNTIVFCNYNWYVSIWSIKFVSPLTTRISVFSSFPARRPWCSNSLKFHWSSASISAILKVLVPRDSCLIWPPAISISASSSSSFNGHFLVT